MARLDLEHPLEGDAARRAQEEQGIAQLLARGAGLGEWVREDGLGLRAEEHTAIGGVVVERLDAEPVPHQHQFLARLIPDGEGEDAVQLVDHVRLPLEVAAQEHFGIALRGEPVPQGFQLLTQFAVVVDLAVVGQHGQRDVPLRALRGKHGLGATRRIDDREPAMAQGHVEARPGPAVVRATLTQGLGHGLDGPAFLLEVTLEVEPPGYSTHS
ncbi:hypothetical protein D3C87_1039970 [compost metagenome]